MLDIGKAELLIMIVVILLVMGPKELPRILRSMFGMVRKVRSMANDFQNQMEELARDSDLEDIQKGIQSVNSKQGQDKLLSALGVDEDLQNNLKDADKNLDKDLNELKKDASKPESKIEETKIVAKDEFIINEVIHSPASIAPANSLMPKAETVVDAKTELAPAAKAPKKARVLKTEKTETSLDSAPKKVRTKAKKIES